jgi:hypothetical protein
MSVSGTIRPAPSLVMDSLNALGPAGLSFTYSVSHTLSRPLDVGLYRSPTATFDLSSAVGVGIAHLSGAGLATGKHTVLTTPRALKSTTLGRLFPVSANSIHQHHPNG